MNIKTKASVWILFWGDPERMYYSIEIICKYVHVNMYVFPGQGRRYSSSLCSVWQLAYGCSSISICWSEPWPREQQATITNTPRLCHRIHSVRVCVPCLYINYICSYLSLSHTHTQSCRSYVETKSPVD